MRTTSGEYRTASSADSTTFQLPEVVVEIGGRQILWHIMKLHAHNGFTDFVFCLGYRGNMVKEYFLNYEATPPIATQDVLTQFSYIKGSSRKGAAFERIILMTPSPAGFRGKPNAVLRPRNRSSVG